MSTQSDRYQYHIQFIDGQVLKYTCTRPVTMDGTEFLTLTVTENHEVAIRYDQVRLIEMVLYQAGGQEGTP